MEEASFFDSEFVTACFLKGRGRDRLTNDEKNIIEAARGAVREVPARYQIIRRGERTDKSTYLIDGFISRYMDDREGHRQIVTIHVPGDFVDLHAYPMKQLDHDVATLTPARIATFDHAKLDEINANHPHLTRFLWFSTLLDAAMNREWIFRLGRLGAEGRVAHFFSELDARLEMVGLASDGRFPLPITQADLAEACGLTPVHVNRTLRSLREDGLLQFRNGEVTIADRTRLARLGEFNPDYLYGETAGWLGGPG